MRANFTAATAVVVASVSAAAFAGDLNPPGGPVAPTMRTLDELAGPSVDVNSLPGSSEAVHVISAPGLYHLSAPVVGVPGKHGILIDNPGGPVALSGNGLELRGVAGSMSGVRTRATALKSLKDLVISGWGGAGIEDGGGTTFEDNWRVLKSVTIHDVGAQGIRIIAGDQDVELVIDGCDIVGAGAEGILFDDPASPPSGTPLLKYRLSNIHMDTTGGDGIHLDAAGFDSKGAIKGVLVNRAMGIGVVVRDDALLDGVKVSYSAMTGVVGRHFVTVKNCVVENSGGASALAGDHLRLESSLFSNGAGGGVTVGNGAGIDSCSFNENERALTGGSNLVIRGTTFHGAVDLGSYSNITGSIMLVDLEHPSFVRHSFAGGSHRIVDCEFGVHGISVAKFPAVLLDGDQIQVLRSRFVMVDPPGAPAGRGARSAVCAFVKIEGVNGEFAENSIMNIHPGTHGLHLVGLLVPAVQHIRSTSASTSGAGAATGISVDADGCMITGNRFIGFGSVGTPLSVTGTGNYVGTVFVGMPGGPTAPCDPDKNLVVP